jgi:hypothetical protein
MLAEISWCVLPLIGVSSHVTASAGDACAAEETATLAAIATSAPRHGRCLM